MMLKSHAWWIRRKDLSLHAIFALLLIGVLPFATSHAVASSTSQTVIIEDWNHSGSGLLPSGWKLEAGQFNNGTGIIKQGDSKFLKMVPDGKVLRISKSINIDPQNFPILELDVRDKTSEPPALRVILTFDSGVPFFEDTLIYTLGETHPFTFQNKDQWEGYSRNISNDFSKGLHRKKELPKIIKISLEVEIKSQPNSPLIGEIAFREDEALERINYKGAPLSGIFPPGTIIMKMPNGEVTPLYDLHHQACNSGNPKEGYTLPIVYSTKIGDATKTLSDLDTSKVLAEARALGDKRFLEIDTSPNGGRLVTSRIEFKNYTITRFRTQKVLEWSVDNLLDLPQTCLDLFKDNLELILESHIGEAERISIIGGFAQETSLELRRPLTIVTSSIPLTTLYGKATKQKLIREYGKTILRSAKSSSLKGTSRSEDENRLTAGLAKLYPQRKLEVMFGGSQFVILGLDQGVKTSPFLNSTDVRDAGKLLAIIMRADDPLSSDLKGLYVAKQDLFRNLKEGERLIAVLNEAIAHFDLPTGKLPTNILDKLAGLPPEERRARINRAILDAQYRDFIQDYVESGLNQAALDILNKTLIEDTQDVILDTKEDLVIKWTNSDTFNDDRYLIYEYFFDGARIDGPCISIHISKDNVIVDIVGKPLLTSDLAAIRALYRSGVSPFSAKYENSSLSPYKKRLPVLWPVYVRWPVFVRTNAMVWRPAWGLVAEAEVKKSNSALTTFDSYNDALTLDTLDHPLEGPSLAKGSVVAQGVEIQLLPAEPPDEWSMGDRGEAGEAEIRLFFDGATLPTSTVAGSYASELPPSAERITQRHGRWSHNIPDGLAAIANLRKSYRYFRNNLGWHKKGSVAGSKTDYFSDPLKMLYEPKNLNLQGNAAWMGGYFAIGNSSIANDLSIWMHEYTHFVISQIIRNGRGVNFCTGENGEIAGAIEESLADIFSVLMRMSVPGPHVNGSSGEAWKIGELTLGVDARDLRNPGKSGYNQIDPPSIFKTKHYPQPSDASSKVNRACMEKQNTPNGEEIWDGVNIAHINNSIPNLVATKLIREDEKEFWAEVYFETLKQRRRQGRISYKPTFEQLAAEMITAVSIVGPRYYGDKTSDYKCKVRSAWRQVGVSVDQCD
jgi:Zn-dependent metalloprotease